MASTQAVLLEKLLETKAQSQNVAASIFALKLQTEKLDAQLCELISELRTAVETSKISKQVPINLMPETKKIVSNSSVLVPVVKLNRVQSKDSASLILQSNHKKSAAKGTTLPTLQRANALQTVSGNLIVEIKKEKDSSQIDLHVGMAASMPTSVNEVKETTQRKSDLPSHQQKVNSKKTSTGMNQSQPKRHSIASITDVKVLRPKPQVANNVGGEQNKRKRLQPSNVDQLSKRQKLNKK